MVPALSEPAHTPTQETMDMMKQRFFGAPALSMLLVLLLAGCTSFAAALPPTPSPFPTAAPLPTITPLQPSPTLPPTATARPAPTAAPDPASLTGIVLQEANIRTGPSLEAPIIDGTFPGTTVLLLERTGSWYRVGFPGEDIEGWIAAQLIEVDRATEEQIPTALIQRPEGLATPQPPTSS